MPLALSTIAMRMFKPEVESLIKALVAISLIALVLVPISWGYEQRRQARAWQSVACAYRVREVAQRATMVRVDYATDPCGALQRLGFDLEPPR
ncbi:MAG: hypothetical protein AUH30_13470 [Candidatus Rokubacteria bacterium 13_1_40CM_68_15]|nr:MAG: hypothetical protein AUH30_13470 [Candidatus Rokubacteria bacterium 13_1_40CM_68_15]